MSSRIEKYLNDFLGLSDMNTPVIKENEVFKNGLVLDNDKLPLTIIYKEKRYVLILTKNDKLILNKYED